eukprot:3462513-Alexandrium_andersonii.AAC.1
MARDVAVGRTALGHLEDGRSDRFLLRSVVSHDADGQAEGLQTVNGVRENSLDRSTGRNPSGERPVPLRT